MKLKRIVSIAAAVALTGGSALAQDAGWYARGDVGASSAGEFDEDAGSIDLDDGWAGAVGGGYAFGNGLRAEGELLYMSNDLDSAADGDTKTTGAFANVAYDFNRQGRLHPFVGAGVGFAQVDFDNGTVDDDDIGFAYQAKAGLGYDVNERMTAEVAYRYVDVTDVEFGSNAASSLSGDYDNQAVTVGVRYKIG